jgi:LysM repeat protein
LGLSGADCSTKFWASEFYCIGATATVPVTAPGPAQTGITASCNKYAQAIADDTCSVLASRNSISNAQLFAWNGVLGTDGQNCQTSLWTGEWYCVGIASGALAVTTTSTTTKISSHMTAPGPTQTGISSNCITFAQAISGDSCDAFATKNHITNALLYAWNSVLGSTGQNCGTSLLAQEWYCVAVSGGSTSAAPTTTAKTTSATKTASTTATTTSHVTAPGPTQTGVSANCNKYAAAISGDSCDAFAKRNSITNANLYAWNTVLGTNGANCGTSLWAQEYYCIGISS